MVAIKTTFAIKCTSKQPERENFLSIQFIKHALLHEMIPRPHNAVLLLAPILGVRKAIHENGEPTKQSL